MSTFSKNANQATRSANRCPVFGLPQNLTEMNLPSYCDVMKHYTYVRLEHSNKMNSREQPSVTEVATIVAKKTRSNMAENVHSNRIQNKNCSTGEEQSR